MKNKDEFMYLCFEQNENKGKKIITDWVGETVILELPSQYEDQSISDLYDSLLNISNEHPEWKEHLFDLYNQDGTDCKSFACCDPRWDFYDIDWFSKNDLIKFLKNQEKYTVLYRWKKHEAPEQLYLEKAQKYWLYKKKKLWKPEGQKLADIPSDKLSIFVYTITNKTDYDKMI